MVRVQTGRCAADLEYGKARALLCSDWSRRGAVSESKCVGVDGWTRLKELMGVICDTTTRLGARPLGARARTAVRLDARRRMAQCDSGQVCAPPPPIGHSAHRLRTAGRRPELGRESSTCKRCHTPRPGRTRNSARCASRHQCFAWRNGH